METPTAESGRGIELHDYQVSMAELWHDAACERTGDTDGGACGLTCCPCAPPVEG